MCIIAQNAFFLLYYSDDRFSTGDERVEQAHSNLGPTQLHMYRTRSKNSPTLNFFGKEVLFKWTLMVTNFPFL